MSAPSQDMGPQNLWVIARLPSRLPNSWRWEREEFPGSALGAKYGGTREAAWIAFGLTGQEIHSEDRKVTARVFALAVRADQSLTVNYEIDGKEVASKFFAKDKLFCGKDGLTITTSNAQESF